MNTERHGVFIEHKSTHIYHKSFVVSDDGSEDKILEIFVDTFLTALSTASCMDL